MRDYQLVLNGLAPNKGLAVYDWVYSPVIFFKRDLSKGLGAPDDIYIESLGDYKKRMTKQLKLENELNRS